MKLYKEVRFIETDNGKMKIIVLRPKYAEKLPGILWIHGGGYMMGRSEMVYFSVGRMLAEKYGAVVISPEYRLATESPYPAALNDCYAALEYMYDNADELGIDRSKIITGGESAGGGLCAAVTMYARDIGRIPVKIHFPLYPMIDCDDTDSSRDCKGLLWDTKRNHWGWMGYLGDSYGSGNIPKYASPSKENDMSGMPPCYTFVQDREPFFSETLTYVEKMKKAGVTAEVDVYHGSLHAFDLLLFTGKSRKARKKLCDFYTRLMKEG